MDLQSPELNFPTSFCCNCGDLNCSAEIQDTRVTRYFAIYGTGNTFRLSVPVCAGCRRTLRRRPPVLLTQLGVFLLSAGAWLITLYLLGKSVTLPLWVSDHAWKIGAALGAITTLIVYRLRRAKPPRTSFHQPVRIKQASVRFDSVMSGPGAVQYLKLGFTNPDYLNVFVNANGDAIKAGHLSVVRS